MGRGAYSSMDHRYRGENDHGSRNQQRFKGYPSQAAARNSPPALEHRRPARQDQSVRGGRTDAAPSQLGTSLFKAGPPDRSFLKGSIRVSFAFARRSTARSQRNEDISEHENNFHNLLYRP